MAAVGWRASATTVPEQRVSRGQAVQEDRQESHVERGCGRFKGAPLSSAPLVVQRDDHVVGLTHLLSLAFRVLTLMEGVVRRRVHQHERTLVGRSTESPRMATSLPPAERLFHACVAHDCDRGAVAGSLPAERWSAQNLTQ
jgi:hypothetical protein